MDSQNDFKPRPCEINSHQFFMRGIWHAWFQRDGNLYAVVEDVRGDVSKFEISGRYSIKFTDRDGSCFHVPAIAPTPQEKCSGLSKPSDRQSASTALISDSALR